MYKLDWKAGESHKPLMFSRRRVADMFHAPVYERLQNCFMSTGIFMDDSGCGISSKQCVQGFIYSR